MKHFKVIRTDTYVVEFEAEDELQANEMLDNDDALLNNGSFSHSLFDGLEEIE